jgi:hypothetical protein
MPMLTRCAKTALLANSINARIFVFISQPPRCMNASEVPDAND